MQKEMRKEKNEKNEKKNDEFWGVASLLFSIHVLKWLALSSMLKNLKYPKPGSMFDSYQPLWDAMLS